MYTNLKSHLIARELEVRSAEATSPRLGSEASRARSVEPWPRRVWRRLHRRFPTTGKPRIASDANTRRSP
jgi:hypothetical protein